jgi:hypothetical protein
VAPAATATSVRSLGCNSSMTMRLLAWQREDAALPNDSRPTGPLARCACRPEHVGRVADDGALLQSYPADRRTGRPVRGARRALRCRLRLRRGRHDEPCPWLTIGHPATENVITAPLRINSSARIAFAVGALTYFGRHAVVVALQRPPGERAAPIGGDRLDAHHRRRPGRHRRARSHRSDPPAARQSALTGPLPRRCWRRRSTTADLRAAIG